MLAAQLLAGGNQSPSFAPADVAERYADVAGRRRKWEDWSRRLSERQIEYAARDAAVLFCRSGNTFEEKRRR